MVRGGSSVFVHQRIHARVKMFRNIFGVFHQDFNVHARRQPAQCKEHGQQRHGNEQPPNIDIFHIGGAFLWACCRRCVGGGGRGDVLRGQTGAFLHFGTQARIFMAQAQQAAEQGEQAEQRTHHEHAEHDDNQR